jgi:hypothetical protein
MWRCTDNQDVGLEAATIERVRNSSLVEWRCAENVTGLNWTPKLWLATSVAGVGERSVGGEAMLESMVERTEVRMPV